MKKVTKFLFLIVMFNCSALFAQITPLQTAKALRHNVVSVNAIMSNGSNQRGYAWVIGEGNNTLYLVTANHVVDGANPGQRLKKLTIQFFKEDNTEYPAEVVPGDSKGLDLAILKMAIPNRRPWLYASVDEAYPKVDTTVTYVGGDAKWIVGNQPGTIKRINVVSDQGYDILTTTLGLDVGSSGGPLVGADGIIGMITDNSNEGVGVISISKIKDVLSSRRLPWGLIPASTSPFILDGTWAPRTPNVPDNIRLKFAPTDDFAHLDYELDFPSSPIGNIGIAVIDGDEVRIWQSMSESKMSFGTFKIFSSLHSNSREGIVMDGFITHGDMQKTQVRLVKQKKEADDPRAIAWMKDNPSDFEKMAMKYLPAINVQNNGGSDDEAFDALGANEQQTIMGGVAQGLMLRAGLIRLAELGLTQVKLDIKNNCYIASGQLTSIAQQEQVDKLLTSMTNDANNKFKRNYKTCNQTQVTNSQTEKTNTSDFDFDTELAQPKRILSGLAPDATISIDGECLLLEGKLQSPMHKMMLAKMLQDLAKELSEKSNKELKACDRTSS